MSVLRKICVILTAIPLVLAAQAALAQKYATVDELLRHAKGCQDDPENCEDRLHLEVIDLDVDLKRKAGWTALNYSGGILTATYSGPLMGVPESQKRELLAALEAVRVSLAARTP